MNGKHTLLAVDDEPNVVRSVQELLRLEYRVLGATSADEALAVLRREPVEVILADQRMPDMTGIELLCRVRQEHPDVVRLLFTGFSDLRVVEDAINQAHVHHFIPKPWDPQELVHSIRDACQLHEALADERVESGVAALAGSTGGSSRGKLSVRLPGLPDDEPLGVSRGLRQAVALAANAQRRMIPVRPPVIPGFDFGATYVPRGELSGDFYDFIDLPNDNVGIVIGDVVGSGLPAAMLMAAVRSSLRAHVTDIYDMRDVMAKVARDVCDETAPGDFVTVFYGVLDCRTRTLTYTNGGHCPPLLFHNGKVQPLGTGGPLVGINWNERYPLDTVSLMPGDLLVAYTDGISEATCPAGELFGQARMEQAIWTSVRHGDEAEAVTRRLYAEARQFVSAEGELDDIAVVSIRVLPARPA